MEFSTLNGYKVKDKKAIRYYDIIADMKADTTLKTGMYVKTKGYYSVNDGGSGEYVIKSSSDSFNETLVNNLVAELVIKDSMNIKCFGLYADGVHDDTTLFQTAIDTMSSNKRELVIVGGTYLVSDTLNINQNTCLNIKDKVTINSNYNGVLFLYEEDDNTSNINIIKGSGILYLHSNTGIDSNSVGLQIGSDTSENVNDICFSNLTINNFNVGCNLINKNVWNITFEKCDFFNNSIGVKYGGLEHLNSGERIAFNTCLFTQNKIDVTILTTLWSQMNFHNCSFDFSDCMFYIDWKEPSYSSNRNKISLNQCHIEGIANNLDEIPNDRPIGILYADALYGIIFSLTDSVIALGRSYYWFKVINNVHDDVSRIILKDIYIYGVSSIKKYIPSLSNTYVDYSNVYWGPEIGNINGVYLKRLPSTPISDKVLVNDDPYFKNATTGENTATNNMVVGDYTVTGVTGLTNINVVDNTEFTSGGKKLVLINDTSYSGQYNTGCSLANNKKFKVEPNKRVAFQIYTDLIQTTSGNNKTISTEVKFYDKDDNQTGTVYINNYTNHI